MRIELDRDACISAGRCVASAPGTFAFDDDELVSLVPGAALPEDTALVRVARACPSQAIRLFDGDAEVAL